MTVSLQTTDTRAQLLANRELLSLERATTYLVTRMRLRTPLGAAEFLGLSTYAERGRGAYDKRVQIALTVCNLYRQLFPREYAASGSPLYSTQMEHECYRLLNSRVINLCISEDRRGTEINQLIEEDPAFFLPFIPLSGCQQHDWINGCCGFDRIQTVFKLVLAIIGHEGPRGWHALSSHFRIPRDPSPAPLLAAFGWSHFVYACAVDGSPLRHLPLAFHLVTYKTGNPWLDTLPGVAAGMDWSEENVSKLFLWRKQAEEINANVLALDQWLDEDPTARIARAVELWNMAAKMEAEEGYAGMYVNERGDLE